MTLEALVPRWFRKDDGDEGDWSMPAEFVPPPTAAMPRPRTDDEKLLAAVAAVRDNDRIEMERLRLELGHALKDLHAEKCKSGLLELDLAKEANDKQTLQTDLLEKDRCLSLLRQVLDKFGTKAPPKKERTPRPKKKADRESADPTATADG